MVRSGRHRFCPDRRSWLMATRPGTKCAADEHRLTRGKAPRARATACDVGCASSMAVVRQWPASVCARWLRPSGVGSAPLKGRNVRRLVSVWSGSSPVRCALIHVSGQKPDGLIDGVFGRTRVSGLWLGGRPRLWWLTGDLRWWLRQYGCTLALGVVQMLLRLHSSPPLTQTGPDHDYDQRRDRVRGRVLIKIALRRWRPGTTPSACAGNAGLWVAWAILLYLNGLGGRFRILPALVLTRILTSVWLF